MKYFLDTEFLEGTQDKRVPFLNIKYGQTKPTIDLISIGIIREDNREYYAISKDFNLKEAWNRFDLKINKHYPNGSEYLKEYWIRENVLRPIFNELVERWAQEEYKANQLRTTSGYNPPIKFNYKNLKHLIDKYGKTNKQIAEEIINFTQGDPVERNNPIFYTYYGAYDWVVFCWIFGKMIDLPRGFPMFSIDLKVMLDDKVLPYCANNGLQHTFKSGLNLIKTLPTYPKQYNAHNALDDAKWNRNLYEFIKTL